jgi:hypothetical protein
MYDLSPIKGLTSVISWGWPHPEDCIRVRLPHQFPAITLHTSMALCQTILLALFPADFIIPGASLFLSLLSDHGPIPLSGAWTRSLHKITTIGRRYTTCHPTVPAGHEQQIQHSLPMCQLQWLSWHHDIEPSMNYTVSPAEIFLFYPLMPCLMTHRELMAIHHLNYFASSAN